MRKQILIFFLAILLIGFISAESMGYGKPTDSINYGANYSINVNNTNYLQGYTPTTLKDWIQGLFELVFVKFDNIVDTVGNWSADKGDYIPYTGANQNVDLGNNNLTLNKTLNISGGVIYDNGTDYIWDFQ